MMDQLSEIICHTQRLILRSPRLIDQERLRFFEDSNRDHFAQWSSTPLEPVIDYDQRLLNWKKELLEGKSVRFFMFFKNESDGAIIGSCNFTQIFRGAFQACYLGYQIDRQHEGKGLMYEALKRSIQYMFNDQRLHRIMANYMPSNIRSAALLKKLEFTIEGKARDYLRINHRWEDHILTSLTNDQWISPDEHVK